MKGIYRLSGVKSHVEQLCQSFETDEHTVDLSLHHPNVIANVLKLYFRQVALPQLSISVLICSYRWWKLLGRAGHGPPTFWTPWALLSLARPLLTVEGQGNP